MKPATDYIQACACLSHVYGIFTFHLSSFYKSKAFFVFIDKVEDCKIKRHLAVFNTCMCYSTSSFCLMWSSPFQYLTTVIPYEKKAGSPSVEDLQILTKSECTSAVFQAVFFVLLRCIFCFLNVMFCSLPASPTRHEGWQREGACTAYRLHS